MSIATERLAPVPAPPPEPRRSGSGLLLAGAVGRTWLWFVAGCLIVTLLPMVLGWRPYVVESGSMEPRIHVGDVVLAAPVANADDLLGRVAVFDDPNHPGAIKTHRVITVGKDGHLTTKGDANPTPDSGVLTLDHVRGLGRLLVTDAGLPLIWVRTHAYGWLLLFVLSLLLAAWIVSRDHDDEVTDTDADTDSDDDGPDGPGGELLPLPQPSGGPGSALKAASTQTGVGLSRRARPALARAAWIVAATLALSVPTAGASLAATAKNTANAWTVGNWNYTTTVTGLSPWLYWKLDETTGTVAADTSGNGRTATYYSGAAASATGFTRGVVGALATDTPNLAVTLDGSTACVNTTSTTAVNAPTQLTMVLWFKTTTTSGGKLLGFETPRTGVGVAGSGGTYDRHLYMDGNGRVWFGVYNAGYYLIESPTALNDGQWHMAAATFGSTGMVLYIDGSSVGTATQTTGETTTGWFRAGCGNLSGWGTYWTGGNNPGTNSAVTADRRFAGSLDEVSIWQSVLTAAQVRSMFVAH